MNRVILPLAGALVATVAISAVLARRCGAPAPTAASAPSATRAEAAQDPASAGPPSRHVRRLTAEDRAKLAAQIARARAAGPRPTPAAGGPAPALPPASDPDAVLAALTPSLAEIKPYLLSCMDAEKVRAGSVPDAVLTLTVTGAGTEGSLIERTVPTSPVLDPSYAACLGHVLAGLALPAIELGATFEISVQVGAES